MSTSSRPAGGAPSWMVFLLAGLFFQGDAMAQDRSSNARASLGVRTQVPTAELAEKIGIAPIPRIRPQQWKGRIISEVVGGSGAERAGLKVGQAILEIAGNVLVSQDDLNDYIGVCKPGEEISVLIKRPSNEKPEEIKVRLDKEPAPDGSADRLRWHYAGLGQLELALKEAQEKKRIVMVGLSGAET